MKQREVLPLRRENGRIITVDARGLQVVLNVWRKNDGVLLCLLLDDDEAKRLRDMLGLALGQVA